MIGRIAIGLVALLILVGGIVGGVIYWNKLNAPETTATAGPEKALGDDALDTGDTAETSPLDETAAPDMGSEDTAPAAETPAEPEMDVTDGAETTAAAPEQDTEVEVDVMPDDVQPADDAQPAEDAVADAPKRPERQPAQAQRTTRAVDEPAAAATEAPVTATPAGDGTSKIESIVIEPVATPTPKPAADVTPVPTTPVATPTPSLPKGNYRVYSTIPILDAQLPQIRAEMSKLGARLTEQAGAKQPMQAYKVSLGYFVERQQAQEWGRNYLRPKGIEYKIYDVQGMSSIQLGVFTNQANVDRKINQLYQAFPGWRLPIRTEMTTIMKPTYTLSLRGITEQLASKIQMELGRLGIPAEVTGI